MSDDAYPRAVQCRGGWFAVWREGDVGSGPWATKEAAEAALAHNYGKAHELERVA